MRRKILNAAILFAVLGLYPPAWADTSTFSGIAFFRSDVTVRVDSTLEVREEIDVRDAARFYKRGFRWDLPISPLDRWDVKYVGTYKPDNGVRVQIREVTEDGSPARYEQGSGYGYPQISIGERGAPLDSGEHRFVIRYIVEWAMNPGAASDNLYWNAFEIERESTVAEAVLAMHLPPGVSPGIVQAEPRVGGRGLSLPRQPENTLDRIDDAPDAIAYRATNIRPHQSLSLVLTWPAGAIHKPRFEFLRRDGRVLAAPAGLFLFYLVAWIWIGPDLKPGVVVSRYEPPDGLSPAAIRFIATGTTDGRSFAAVIAQLAVRGCLRIEPQNGKYKLSRLMSDRATESSLAPEEKRALAVLFEDGPEIELSAAFDQRNQAQNGRYVNHIHEELRKQIGGKYLTRHAGVIALGGLLTFVPALVLAITARGRDATGALFMTLWILFCGLMLGAMIEMSFARAWRTTLRSGKGWLSVLPGTAAIAVFGGAIALLLKDLASGVSVSFALMVAALLAVNLGWAPQLKRKTKLGREVLDMIAGFRQFLEKVEQDRMNRLNPPSETPDGLDRFIPYAIALDVKEAWGDRLAQTFLASVVVAEE